MISFLYSLFTDTEDFPIHLQYGFHEEELYLHTHADFSELVIVLDGSAFHTVGEESSHISKGDVFVVGQDTEHGYKQTERLTICNVMFRQEVFDHVFDLRQLPGFQALFVLEPHYSQSSRFLSQLKLYAEPFAETEQHLTEMMREYESRRAGWREAVFAEFLKLCVHLSRQYQLENDSKNDLLKLASAAAYIEYHFSEQITLSELSEISGYSERQFHRLFRAIYRMTPNAYITELRMKKAQNLLQSTRLNIGDIAWRCGCDDQNYFSRIFKRHTGMTPTEYRAHLNLLLK